MGLTARGGGVSRRAPRPLRGELLRPRAVGDFRGRPAAVLAVLAAAAVLAVAVAEEAQRVVEALAAPAEWSLS